MAWRTSLRRIWNLPSCTHSQLLPLICKCLPLIDEICRRSLFFIRPFALHDLLSIRFVAQDGATNTHSQSILGQNVSFCTRRYHRSMSDIIYNPVDIVA